MKFSPVSTAAPSCGKTPANHHIPDAVDRRTFIVRTVDNLPSTGDSGIECRPQERPANHYIHGDAGDTCGSLRDSSGKTNVVVFSEVQPHRLEVLKVASNVLCSLADDLGGSGPDGLVRALKIACTRISVRRADLY